MGNVISALNPTLWECVPLFSFSVFCTLLLPCKLAFHRPGPSTLRNQGLGFLHPQKTERTSPLLLLLLLVLFKLSLLSLLSFLSLLLLLLMLLLLLLLAQKLWKSPHHSKFWKVREEGLVRLGNLKLETWGFRFQSSGFWVGFSG